MITISPAGSLSHAVNPSAIEDYVLVFIAISPFLRFSFSRPPLPEQELKDELGEQRRGLVLGHPLRRPISDELTQEPNSINSANAVVPIHLYCPVGPGSPGHAIGKELAA